MDDAKIFSCEFFPPRTEAGMEKLLIVRNELDENMHPAFYSVTFGAGGTNRDRTLDAVDRLREDNASVAPHISCIGSTRDQLKELIERYSDRGVTRLVTLRGDIPEEGPGANDFKHANELVAFIREQSGDHFHIEVAAYPEYHPQATSPDRDLQNFKRKVEAGANSAITQYFYNTDAYFRFVDRCRSVNLDIDIVPGVMPITNYFQLARFSDACGAEIPRWIRKRLESYGEDLESIRTFGEEVVTKLCARLLDEGAPGLHFYTLNRAEPALAIWNNLGLGDSTQG